MKSLLCFTSGYEPSAACFKVQTTEGKTYLLRHDEQDDEWTLQSGFDGDELFARPSTGHGRSSHGIARATTS